MKADYIPLFISIVLVLLILVTYIVNEHKKNKKLKL